MKRDLIELFLNEIYSKPPRKNYPTNKINYNNIDEIGSNDLADFPEYKSSNNKRFRYIFVSFDKFSKKIWCIPLKNKYGETMTQNLSNLLTK